MNISYFRKSKFDLEKTVDNLIREAKRLELTVLGQTKLPSGNVVVIQICNPNWMGNLIASDANLIGLLPCSVAVIVKNDEVSVGVGSPSILGSVSQNPAIAQIAGQAEAILKELIHRSSGTEALKPVGVKLYSTTTCPYCKMEASWLTDKKVKFEEVKVDLDQTEAEEMVRKTGQMGVPVTAIKYEGGEEEFIVGFDKSKLTQVLQIS
jgi:glutaredoxin